MMNDDGSVSILTLALQAVTARMLILIAMSMTFGLFCWAMFQGTTLALWVAGAFAVTVFLPVLLKGDGRVREKAN